MSVALLIPVFLGAIGILQAGMNRTMSDHIGLTHAAFLGNVVTVVVCLFFLLWVKLSPNSVPEFMQLKVSWTTIKWWYIIPGIFGFLFVVGLPWGIYKVGAVKLTVGLIAAQMITGVLWDIFVEKIPMNTMKIAGMVSALLSVVLITFSK